MKAITRANMAVGVGNALRRVVWILLRVLPALPHAVVHGWPDNEANSIETVRGLRRRYRGRTYWLLDDVTFRGPEFSASDLADASRVIKVRKGSIRAIWLSLTAELTFFTHGLYTAVGAPSNRLVVNLWHGDGPKATNDTHLVRSTVVVSATRLWGLYKARIFGVREDALAIVGNPRSDQFSVPLTDDAIDRLGLTPGRRRVLWMPTFRDAKGPRDRAWSDGDRLTDSAEVGEIVRSLAEAAERLGFEILIKPHPLDNDAYAYKGLHVLRGEDLDTAGVSLYQLIGGADALISDISSVWVDYLVLNRPIGFFIPDLEELKSRRGLNVDNLEAILPGPRIRTPEAAAKFLEQVYSHSLGVLPKSFPGAAGIGVVTELGCTDRLLDWLSDFQRSRGRTVLFEPSPHSHAPVR